MPKGRCLTGCGRSGGACCPKGRSAANAKPPGDCICFIWAAAYRANGDSTDCRRDMVADAALQEGGEEAFSLCFPRSGLRPACTAAYSRLHLSWVPSSCCSAQLNKH